MRKTLYTHLFWFSIEYLTDDRFVRRSDPNTWRDVKKRENEFCQHELRTCHQFV